MQLKKWRLYVTRWWGDDVHCTPGRNGTEFFACLGQPVPRGIMDELVAAG